MHNGMQLCIQWYVLYPIKTEEEEMGSEMEDESLELQ